MTNPQLTISANMEWLFTEAGENFADRIRSAAERGIPGVELWGWQGLDLAAIEAALTETGTLLISATVDTPLHVTDPTTHDEFIAAVGDPLAVAQRLGSPSLVVTAGHYLPEVSPWRERAAIVSALTRAAERLKGSGVTLLLEPLNSRVDHPGTYLSATSEGLAIVEEVGRLELRLLLDVYHALMMGENLRAAVANRMALVGHVQIADIPGRHEPGSGEVDWPDLVRTLLDLGYRGPVGLEYMPTTKTGASLSFFESVLRQEQAAFGPGPPASGRASSRLS